MQINPCNEDKKKDQQPWNDKLKKKVTRKANLEIKIEFHLELTGKNKQNNSSN